jgi:hypothetical protein
VIAQSYTGAARYMEDHPTEDEHLIVAVSCEVGDLGYPIEALLDTAAEWSVLSSDVARRLGFSTASDGLPMRMLTRYGLVEGVVVSIPLTFPASEGEPLTLEARWFVCDDWPLPSVIGWRGCLQWMRIGLDPDRDTFFFALSEGTNPADAPFV